MIGSSFQAAVEALPEITVAITDRQREDRGKRGAEQGSFLELIPNQSLQHTVQPSIQI